MKLKRVRVSAKKGQQSVEQGQGVTGSRARLPKEKYDSLTLS